MVRLHRFASLTEASLLTYATNTKIRTLVKSANQKNNILISHPKHMLWVLKRTVSMLPYSQGDGSFEHPKHNICCGYSKEPSQRDGSFEHPKHILKLMAKKIITILHQKNCLSKPMKMS